VTAVSATVLLLALYAAVPSLRMSLSIEDHALENVSLGLYLIGGLLAALALVRGSSVPRIQWVIPAGALLAILEEVGWGERVLNLRMPVISGVQIDAIQDVPELLVILLVRGGPSWWAAGLLVAGLAIYCAYRLRAPVGRLATRLGSDPALRFMLLWLALGLLAVIPDQAIGLSFHMIIIEELLDILAAFALLCAGLAVASGAPEGR